RRNRAWAASRGGERRLRQRREGGEAGEEGDFAHLLGRPGDIARMPSDLGARDARDARAAAGGEEEGEHDGEKAEAGGQQQEERNESRASGRCGEGGRRRPAGRVRGAVAAGG